MLLDQVPDGPLGDAEQARRRGLHAAGAGERVHDEGALEMRHLFVERQVLQRCPTRGRPHRPGGSAGRIGGGKLLSASTSPSLTTTARSIMLRSSRTLPGQRILHERGERIRRETK